MYRFIKLASILVLAALQSGCCSSPCGKGMGCGRSYWGAYADDPPTCEPCDKCGNFTGGHRTCKTDCDNGQCGADDCDFQWTRGQRVSLLGGLFNTSLFDCGTGHGSCTQPSCGEPTCSEPSCGSEPGCGFTQGVSYESEPATTAWRGTPRTMNASYTGNSWTQLGTPGGCKCGKH